MQIDRRKFLGAAAAFSMTKLSVAQEMISDDYWAKIAADFEREPGVINLEHGYWTKLARPVAARYREHQQFVNRRAAVYARQDWQDDLHRVQARLATKLACKPDELALTRNASESLKALISGYRHVSAGDAVLYADLDYPSVQHGFDSLAAERGASVVKIDLPEPASYDGIIDAYQSALDANPNVRLMVLTHISNRTGLLVPVREIIEIARARNVDVIVDAAHSWGQLDFNVDDIDADFIAFNLHKWIGAPLGVGFLYIRESRLDAIAPDPAAAPAMAEKTAGRVYVGTMSFAAVRAVEDALDYCDSIGWDRKEQRLRALRDAWARDAAELPNVEVLTPNDPRLYAGITSFRLKGQVTDAQNAAVAERLYKEHGIFTVFRTGVAKGSCIRVTPGLENLEDDCLSLLEAIRVISA